MSCMAEVAQKGEWRAGGTYAGSPGVTVSGRGLMLGVESGKPAGALVSDLLSRGVVALTAKDQAAAPAAAYHPMV